ncbi:hypothetical protein [Rariglobus hedericola]|uniref:WD40 repeat domain-containing protein n=1 Tax=Rariglobus hedericola TaxID=2597822 RepID=A0A556QJA8_9BACT|nr:hypothetical protein [Rariglobus hedericola]TSJ76733.1 hypothetical protein FPL22_11445 [Rariglobus hedericola]
MPLTFPVRAAGIRVVSLFAVALFFAGATTRADTIFQTDSRPVGLSAQDNTGEVWAIGFSDEKLLRWTSQGWKEMADATPREGSLAHLIHQSAQRGSFPVTTSHSPPPAGIIALWSSPQGGVESLWELREPASPEAPNEQQVARLFHYRHTLPEPWIRLGLSERRWVKPKDLFARGHDENEAWKSAPFYRLIPTENHLWLLSSPQERTRSLGVWNFDRSHGLQSFPLTSIPASSLRKPRMALDASGALWVWGEQADPYNSKDHPRFFTRFADGKFDATPKISGLPDSAITEFVTLEEGRTAVAALENEGLWTVDLISSTGTQRSSPPLPAAAKIWFWQAWPDGLEVALANDPGDNPARHHEYFWAVAWVRQNGEWRAHGRFHYNSSQGSAMLATTGKGARWIRYDGHLILTGPHRAHVLALNQPDAVIRPLGWRIGSRGHFPSGAYVLPSGEAIVTGISSVILKPGELAAALAQPEPAIITFSEPVQGIGDTLAALEEIGPGKGVVNYWDGQRLRQWAAPEDDKYNALKLMQDSERRLWLLKGAEDPVWVLDPGHPEPIWQRHKNLRARVAEEASSGKPTWLAAKRSEENNRPVWHSNGQALLWLGGDAVSLFKANAWKSLPPLKNNGGIAGLQFSADGHPEVSLYESLETEQVWRYQDESGWRQQSSQPSRYAREQADRKKASVTPPESIFKGLRPAGQVWPSPVVDSHGTWWLLKDGELWRDDGGVSRRALPATLRVPWTTREWYELHSVRQDIKGNHYFWMYSDVTIVPQEIWE